MTRPAKRGKNGKKIHEGAHAEMLDILANPPGPVPTPTASAKKPTKDPLPNHKPRYRNRRQLKHPPPQHIGV